jgi:hypothetical protein
MHGLRDLPARCYLTMKTEITLVSPFFLIYHSLPGQHPQIRGISGLVTIPVSAIGDPPGGFC